MAVGETPVTVLGTVISDVTLKRVGEHSHELTTFLLRTSERKYDKERGEWHDHRPFAIRVKCWRRLAVAVHDILRRGDPVIVAGRLYVSDFETSDGQARSSPEVEAWAVGPNLTLCRVAVQRDQRGQPGGGASRTWEASVPSGEKSAVEVGEPVPVF